MVYTGGISKEQPLRQGEEKMVIFEYRIKAQKVTNATRLYQIDHLPEVAKPTRKSKKKLQPGYYVTSISSGSIISGAFETIEAAQANAELKQDQIDKRTAERTEAAQSTKVEVAKEEAKVEAGKTAAQSQPLATPRQVDFIMALIAQGKADEGGFFSGPRDIDGVKTMTKAGASAYISSMLGDY